MFLPLFHRRTLTAVARDAPLKPHTLHRVQNSMSFILNYWHSSSKPKNAKSLLIHINLYKSLMVKL